MTQPARNRDTILQILHATIGEPMTQHLLATHNLGDDIADLLSGDLSLREFGNGLHETLQVAASAMPQEVPPASTKSFILLNPREMHALVDVATSRIAGKEPSAPQR